MSLERLTVSGSPRERGRAHGEAYADAVAANVETYRERFVHEGLDWPAVRDRARELAAHIERERPDYHAEMRGIAAGADVPFVDVAVLNARWEVIYAAWSDDATGSGDGPSDATDGCTSFGVTPPATADGHTYVGQNWDWLAGVREGLFVLEVTRPDAPDFLAMTEAGIAGGKCGLNEHGVGLAVNGLVSPADGVNADQVPYHARFRDVLDAERLDEALSAVTATRRVASANVVVGAADGAGGEVLDLEVTPDALGHRHPEEGVLTHANHFVTDASPGPAVREGTSTLYRAERLRRHLAGHAGGVDADAIRAGLQDHFGRPASVCSHVDESVPAVERGRTNASLVLDLDARRMLAARGPPCEHEYATYRLGE